VCIADAWYIGSEQVDFPGGKPGSMAPPVVRMDGFLPSLENDWRGSSQGTIGAAAVGGLSGAGSGELAVQRG
jgi:hypothetical protein